MFYKRMVSKVALETQIVIELFREDLNTYKGHTAGLES